MGKRFDQIFHTKKDIWMVNKNIKRYFKKRYSTSVVIRKMQMKNAKICYEKPTRMAKIRMTDSTKYWWRSGTVQLPYVSDEKGKCSISLENSMVRSSKVKYILRVLISISMFLSKRNESISPPQNLYLKFPSSIFRHNFNLETPPLSINCWADK